MLKFVLIQVRSRRHLLSSMVVRTQLASVEFAQRRSDSLRVPVFYCAHPSDPSSIQHVQVWISRVIRW